MQICYRLGRAVGRILFVLLLVGITMLPAQGQAFSLLHSFYGPEGASPRAALIQGRDGALYGTTPGDTLHNQGSIFKIHMDGTGFQSLRTFEYNKSDGANLNAALLQGQDGALYGTTTYNQGTVFKLNMDGSGFQTIHSFRVGPIDGPSGLIQGKNGALYGTTVGYIIDLGRVIKLKPDGTGFQSLFSFASRSHNGVSPVAALTQGKDGAFYGTTSKGGINNAGTVFKLNPDGTGFRILHSFSFNDGNYLCAALLQGRDGALYGTTKEGGANNAGVVFKLNPDGTSFRILHSFNFKDGNYLFAALIQGKDGALYGTTSKGGARDGGTVFKLNPDGTGFQTLHSFSGSGFNDGAYPYAALLQGKDSALYGTTAAGGARNRGTVFRLAILAP